jgi:hypothetical protein
MIRERPQQGDRYDVMIIPASSLDAKSKVGSWKHRFDEQKGTNDPGKLEIQKYERHI